MTNSLASMAGIAPNREHEPAQEDLAADDDVVAVSTDMRRRGDLYRYVGAKPNHVHKAIPN